MTNQKLYQITQSLDDTIVNNIGAEREKEIALQWKTIPSKGEKVAITVGSRGIANIAKIIETIAKKLIKAGAKPFIVPAMGSHGSATAEGQLAVLKEYGITEEAMGIPILSSMKTVHIGNTISGIPVHIDKFVFSADHVVVVNRIKPHTEFQGNIESGLIKMMVIGLGNHKGATIAHKFAVKFGYERTLTEVGQLILEKAPISLGIGIIENGFGQTAQLSAIPANAIYESERALLKIARSKSPKLPFDELDILIVDEIGKEISGTGMDTKVVGRIMNMYELEVEQPRITRIILRDLTEKTHGNAIGIGLADFVTKRVVDKLDYTTTYINSLTAVTPEKGKIPIICENDKQAIEFAMASIGPVNAENVRIVWIKNTSKLDEMYISKGLIPEVEKKTSLNLTGEKYEFTYDEGDNLINSPV